MAKPHLESAVITARIAKVKAAMREQGVDVCIIPVGGDMGWLIGYEVIAPTEATVIVVKNDNSLPTVIISNLEAGNIRKMAEVYSIEISGPGKEFADAIIELIGQDFDGLIAVGGDWPARYALPVWNMMAYASFQAADAVSGPARGIKDAEEIEALRTGAQATDSVIRRLQSGEIKFRGRTEKQVADEVERLMLADGHETVDFAIVAFGPNAANPHHEPDDTVIGDGILLFDIGGSIGGYHSDTTRCVHVGQPSAEVAAAYAVLEHAQAEAVSAVKPGVAANQIDGVARRVITEANYPDIPHGVGHGIGRDIHEEPRIRVKNGAPIVAGNVFSVEPGIYVEGRYGMRVEDIVVVTTAGSESLNSTDHSLVVVEQ